MRHRNTKAILNRPADQRKALVRNLLTNLFEHGSMKTTEAKAKAVQAGEEAVVLGADQILGLDGQIYDKARSKDEARAKG